MERGGGVPAANPTRLFGVMLGVGVGVVPGVALGDL